MARALSKKEIEKIRKILLEKKQAVVDRAQRTLREEMTLDPNDLADEMDLASSEYNQQFEFRLRGREKKLLAKIELALSRMDAGTFGICEDCDEIIGKKRLEARPETTLCIQCKEAQEREEAAFS